MIFESIERVERVERVRAVLAGARRIADRRDPLGARARRELPRTTGLSPAGVELALERCLEVDASDADVARLVAHSEIGVAAAAASPPRVHVVLPANVFIAPVRAIALAVAASRDVLVRPSRREPIMASLLVEALSAMGMRSPPMLVDAIAPRPGDVVHAYGRAETIEALGTQMPKGVTLRGHGPGFGVVVLEPGELAGGWADEVALDMIAFDQRGCLSPRVVLVGGKASDVESRAAELLQALIRFSHSVPRGTLSDDEKAEAAIYCDTVVATGKLFRAAPALAAASTLPAASPSAPASDTGTASASEVVVGVGPFLLAPAGRHLHCVSVEGPAELRALVVRMSKDVTTFGCSDPAGALARACQQLAPAARLVPIGSMQCPPLDGPADLRAPSSSRASPG